MGRSVFVAFLVIVLMVVGSFLYFQNRWAQVVVLPDPVIVEVPKGYTAIQTANMLEEQELVATAFDFRTYLKYHKLENRLQSGVYIFQDTLDIAKVVNILVSGRTATQKVTIPEGRTSWEVISILKRTYPSLDSIKWISLVNDSVYARSLKVPANSLEGFLFPSTYEFPLKVTEKLLLETMVRHFFKALATLGKENSEVYLKYKDLGVTTLASIVEEESAVAKERVRIAGVFYNRLKLGMPLGADPTVRFIFRNLTGPIYKSQLASDNPYNTRKIAGLPPGPISNPGKEALRAALFPQAHKELYFVAKDDGSREHFFGKSLKEHNRYKNIAARNRARQ